jgi:aspartyl protease family protein
MLLRVVFAATIMVLVTASLPQLLRGLPRSGPAPRAAVAGTAAPPSDMPGRVVLDADAHGHFRTTAMVDGREIDMLVDTGATMVTLRNEDARDLDLLGAGGGFDVPVETANGVAKLRRITLDRLRVGDIMLYDVEALVAPPGVLSENLLGMSALSRLRRFAVDGGRLVLEN